MRPTVLLANELGANYGHVRRLIAIAERIAPHFTPVLAVQDPDSPLLAGTPYACLRSPRIPDAVRPPPRPLPSTFFTMADSLTFIGLTHPPALAAVLAQWDAVLEQVRPVAIVGDLAPMLRLATYGRVPFVAIGDGFVLPPAGPTLARLPGVEPVEPEAAVLDRINSVQRQRGAALENLPALFTGTRDVVCTYPALDPYREQRYPPAVGPLLTPPPPAEPPRQPSVFCYVGPNKKGHAALQALVRAQIPARVYARGGADWIAPYRADHITFLEAPGDLPAECAAASAVVHHGGIGTAETVLAIGRPQIVLPMHFEQMLNRHNLFCIGAGVRLKDWKDEAAFTELVRAAATCPRAAASARSVAMLIAGRVAAPSFEPAVEVVLRALHGLVAKGPV